MKASIGDFIVKGVSCEFYPCKPEVFYQTYEKVADMWNQHTPDIVRCGECVYWEPENCRNPNILMCDQQMTYDDFCSWGERREEK